MELTTDALTLHFEEDGDLDAPPVLVLHGITQSVATWSWLVPHLVEDHRVVRLDFRGHGKSGRTPGAYRFPGYVADATAICEQVLGRPAVIVGHSLGGGTAAGLAQTRPDLVRGVVLEDPAIMSSARPGAATELEGNTVFAAFELMKNSIPAMQEAEMSVAAVADLLRQLPSPSGPPFGEVAFDDAIDAMAEGVLQLDVTVLDPVFDGTIAPVFDPNRELGVPGIVLAGDPASPDTVVTARDLASLTEHSLELERRVVTGAGHMIHDSRAYRDTVLTAVKDQLARVEG
ncbi:MAG TPA: alpha/beta hydrolase [Acidimicrobiales bacterium]|nr:alpha/beta hydrolase [Acidimicrobiales bacterium]